MHHHLKQRANRYYFKVFYENNRFSIFLPIGTQSQCTNHLKINSFVNVKDALGGKKQIMHLLIHLLRFFFKALESVFLVLFYQLSVRQWLNFIDTFTLTYSVVSKSMLD